MPFTSTVQDYSDRFNAVLCHARHLSAPQKAELFVGGLPEHIKVDVELREPQDLQTAMHLARAFERRATATLLAPVQQAWPPQRQPLALPAPVAPARAPTPAAAVPTLPAPPQPPPPAPQQLFRRLTPAEMLERRRQGLCFNCDEPYVRDHQCQRLFFLEADDFLDDAVVDNDGTKEALQEAGPAFQ
jgi:hypothetical protein